MQELIISLFNAYKRNTYKWDYSTTYSRLVRLTEFIHLYKRRPNIHHCPRATKMKHYNLLCLLILLSQNCPSWGWLFSSKDPPPNSNPTDDSVIYDDAIAEFSMEPLSNPKGMKLVENAQRKVVSSNSCWQNAYTNLFAGCSEILAAEEKRSRLAWHLSDCFQKDSGRPAFPRCDSKSLMVNCLKKLDEDARKIYLEFYLETNSICHQLQ